MKINVNNYAGLLYEALMDVKQDDIAAVIDNFVKLLSRNNHLRYSKRIIVGFNELYNKKNNIIKLEVISKEDLSANIIERIKSFFKNNSGADKIELTNKIDREMIGGIVLKTNNEMIDKSVNRMLVDLNRHLFLSK